MGITSDFHLHSYFSGDSTVPTEDMILAGIKSGLTSMCFTEHNDFDFPYEVTDVNPDAFLLDVETYRKSLMALAEKYRDQVRILFGVEIGLQQCCIEKNRELAASGGFDFIIASAHLCQGMDPYYPSFFEGKQASDCYLAYFEELYENLKSFSDFDVCGHLDYIARYAPKEAAPFRYEDFSDLIDEILRYLIQNGKGMEVNTSRLIKPAHTTNPSPRILKRYRELGGEILTVGSDAHVPEAVGGGFFEAADILRNCGFSYYTVFSGRTPSFLKIS
ncbi:MAG: histidinol-phosphatase HisJ family protein [Lachnospiraceae bacterium]|nr:histidinol-phosphatase HisJ family protein [Lachnospiraceae bacterium]